MGGPSTQIHLKCAVNKIEKKKKITLFLEVGIEEMKI